MDILESLVKGKRCGLLTAGSGTDSFGVPTYIKLHERGLLSVLFSPEHGVHSVMQDGNWSVNYIDVETGVPVYNLPGRGDSKIDEALPLCDVVIYDIQDVGARFYTYIYSLARMMKECAKFKIPVIVLDRPNPISGELSKISGAILDEDNFVSSVGMFAMPVRYSMTCGEFAKYINERKSIGCELYVIPCEGWRRSLYADETTMPWINPSPNIPTVNCAVNYIGTCLIEATNISEGRGTTRPFDIVGAPFINSSDLCRKLNEAKLDGVFFSRAFFTPMFGKCQGEACEGVQFNITDRNAYDPHAAGLYLLSALKEYDQLTIREQGLCLRYGRDTLTKDPSFDPENVLRGEMQGIEKFKNEIKNYLIYD